MGWRFAAQLRLRAFWTGAVAVATPGVQNVLARSRPWSQQVLEKLCTDLSPAQRDWILHDNVAELYGLAS